MLFPVNQSAFFLPEEEGFSSFFINVVFGAIMGKRSAWVVFSYGFQIPFLLEFFLIVN